LKTVTVIGIGRVGLPLSIAFAEAGFRVFGVDIREDHVLQLKKGIMPFIEKDADKLLAKHINNNFFPTTDTSVIKDSDFIVITLGTPVDEHLNPDYSQLDSVTPIIIKNLKNGQLIILRSTVAPGTTEQFKDKLEKGSRLSCGKDFFLAYCPERIAEGNAISEIKEVPQIIGGIDHESSVKAKGLIEKITEKCFITDARSAELAKIMTNMYRYINFAIANEFAVLAMEHDRNIHEIIELINRDYLRGGVKKPGFTAGPCLYKDGFFLINSIPFDELISVSWRINENMPLYLLKRIKEKKDIKGRKVAILGLAFKKNIDDTRNSLSYKLKKAFQREQCEVFLHDPFIKGHDTDLGKVIDKADVVVIATNHDQYKELTTDYLSKRVAKGCILCDLWNMTGDGKIIYEF
jgi:UDP-N-acetyl-D-mannosaminuronic acid dehydrogenase